MAMTPGPPRGADVAGVEDTAAATGAPTASTTRVTNARTASSLGRSRPGTPGIIPRPAPRGLSGGRRWTLDLRQTAMGDSCTERVTGNLRLPPRPAPGGGGGGAYPPGGGRGGEGRGERRSPPCSPTVPAAADGWSPRNRSPTISPTAPATAPRPVPPLRGAATPPDPPPTGPPCSSPATRGTGSWISWATSTRRDCGLPKHASAPPRPRPRRASFGNVSAR